ncbi:MAG TPA: MBL fold metallo-hydrolase [Caulobacteraceae bacterium]|jgi:ribonuclease BN (tRNA processing enzyme)|nr:MBL fold metallo-hydrolase [Caulobacteraceae bacterium]
MLKLIVAGALAAELVFDAAHAQPIAAPQSGANEIVLLGTHGGPSADPVRSEPASLLIVGGRPYLIDAGAGVARQLAAAGERVTAIRTVFITHHHLDHTAGLEPLMALSWIGTGLGGRTPPPVQIYGPPATRFLVKAALTYISVSERIFRAGIPSLPAAAGMFVGHDIDHDGLAYQDDRVRVTAVENTHFGHASYGPDGKKDMSFSYRFDTTAGSVVFTGDTGPSDAVTRLAKGADVLVSEVLLPGGGAARAPAKTPLATELTEHLSEEHLTPEEVGRMATAAGVKTVILTHLVIGGSPDAEQRLEAEVRKYYSGTVIVGHDLLKFELSRH